MSYAIIGLGKIGTSIAQAFALQGIEVAVAGRRPLDALAAQIGPSLVPQRIEDAVKADVLILAVPFATHRDIGRAAESWQGKVVIDATNAFDVPPKELGGVPSTAALAKAFPGAKLVKAFNHLPAGVLAQGPKTPQGAGGSCSSPATTMRLAPRWRPSSTGSASPRSSWGRSARAACSSRHGAARGVSLFSRTWPSSADRSGARRRKSTWADWKGE
jgi:NAD(P)-dependent dehydrogenase (short-subunit alcohol dehydrogenase family)